MGGFEGFSWVGWVLSPLDVVPQFKAAFAASTFIGSAIGATIWISRRMNRKTVNQLRAEIRSLSITLRGREQRLVALEAEATALAEFSPARTVTTFEHALRMGDESLATRVLTGGFEAIANDVGRITWELSLYYLTTLAKQPCIGLAEAARFAQLAHLCSPKDGECKALLTEIIAIKAAHRSDPDQEDRREADDQILASIERLLPIQEKAFSAEHPDTLMTRCIEAANLVCLRCFDAALDRVDALLPLERKINGEQHPATVFVCWLRTVILSELGRYEESLDAIEALLPVQGKASSKHPSALMYRALRVGIIQRLADNDEDSREPQMSPPMRVGAH